MTKARLVLVALVAAALSLVLSSPTGAQDAPASASAPRKETPKPVIPLKVQVVLTRYDGEKKIANLPFTLAVNANDQPAQLNMHTQVGVPNTPMRAGSPDVNLPPVSSFTYKTIGTQIVCSATSLDDGRFRLMLNVNDNSMLPDKATVGTPGVSGLPSFQDFSSSNLLILRDGQTVQYAAATDAVTGQVTKIEVTATVIK